MLRNVLALLLELLLLRDQRSVMWARAETGSAAATQRRVTATARFGDAGAHPLAKKFQAYNAGCALFDRVSRDSHLLRGVGAEWLRLDGGMGWDPASHHMPGVFGSIVEAAPGGGLQLDLEPVANYTAVLREQGVKPLYSWAYTPKPLQGPHGGWTSGPDNLTAWREMHRQLARSLRGSGAAHELYNEPDLSWALSAP